MLAPGVREPIPNPAAFAAAELEAAKSPALAAPLMLGFPPTLGFMLGSCDKPEVSDGEAPLFESPGRFDPDEAGTGRNETDGVVGGFALVLEPGLLLAPGMLLAGTEGITLLAEFAVPGTAVLL